MVFISVLRLTLSKPSVMEPCGHLLRYIIIQLQATYQLLAVKSQKKKQFFILFLSGLLKPVKYFCRNLHIHNQYCPY